MTSTLPVQFDKYTQVVKEGEELYGDLYRATDSRVDRPVALKMPHPELLRDPAFVEQFRREGQAAAQLDHPNIVRVYRVGTFEDAPFLEMEAVEGETLAKLMAEKGIFRPLEALPIVNAICAALQEAHSKGVIHGSLTPHDLLLRASDDRIWLRDFGLATAIEASLQADLGSKRKRIAAVRYLSPEQFDRQMGEVGATSDLYSLGVILYEMLTGELPFVGNREDEVGEAHTQGEPAALSTINSKLSPLFDAVVLKALSKQPQARFSSAKQMAEAFRTAAAQEAKVAPAAPPVDLPTDLPRDPTRVPSREPSLEPPMAPPPTSHRLSEAEPASERVPPSKADGPTPVPAPVAPKVVAPQTAVPEPRGWSLVDTGVIAFFVVAAFVTWMVWNSRGEPLLPEPRGSEPTRYAYAEIPTPTPMATSSFAAEVFPTVAIPTAASTTDRTIANVVGKSPMRHLGFDESPDYWAYAADAYAHEVVGDELLVALYEANYNVWRPLTVNSTHYYAEVEVTIEDAEDVSAGVIFNYQDDDNFYLFLIDPNGYYSLWHQVDAEWETALPWSQTSLLHSGGGATNLLGVHMDGERVRLLVNRIVLAEVEMMATPTGGMALYTETYSATDAVMRFGNFRWWDFAMPSNSAITNIAARMPSATFDFSVEAKQWDATDEASTFEARGRTLDVTVHEAEWQSWQTLALGSTDFYFESEVTIHSTSDQIMAGVVFDVVDDENLYSINIDVAGNYAIYQRINGEWSDVQNWIYSPLLRQGSEIVNRIGVMAHGDKYWIIANGQVLDTVDVAPSVTEVGLIAGTYDEDEGKVTFTNTRWWNLTGMLLP